MECDTACTSIRAGCRVDEAEEEVDGSERQLLSTKGIRLDSAQRSCRYVESWHG